MYPKKNYTKNSFTHPKEPRVIQTVRNEHGTRFCQRIECSRCGEIDYVAKKINGAKTIYCRKCAERFLDTFEGGRIIAEKQVTRACSQCKKEFLIRTEIADKKEELQCRDCLRGFEIWRGKMARPDTHKDLRALSLAGGAKTIIRKNTNDAI
jgi:DNA-directed RNA polymerase subunit RPC12/RpoP